MLVRFSHSTLLRQEPVALAGPHLGEVRDPGDPGARLRGRPVKILACRAAKVLYHAAKDPLQQRRKSAACLRGRLENPGMQGCQVANPSSVDCPLPVAQCVIAR